MIIIQQKIKDSIFTKSDQPKTGATKTHYSEASKGDKDILKDQFASHTNFQKLSPKAIISIINPNFPDSKRSLARGQSDNTIVSNLGPKNMTQNDLLLNSRKTKSNSSTNMNPSNSDEAPLPEPPPIHVLKQKFQYLRAYNN